MVDLIARSSWAIRRRIIIATLIWCAMLVTYLAIWGRPTSLSEAIATNLLLLMGGVIGSYVFGAVWDDQSRRKTEVAQSAVNQSDPTTTTTNVKVDQ
ncbi:hypothetical protein [Rhizobium leguminosarum]